MALHSYVRNLAKLAIHHGGISSLARTCLAGRTAILRYHSVSTVADGTHLMMLPPEFTRRRPMIMGACVLPSESSRC